MNQSVSPMIFVYGMAVVLGIVKVCTLLIWQTFARPGLRQELRNACQRRSWRTPVT
jgi:hypothetical protein